MTRSHKVLVMLVPSWLSMLGGILLSVVFVGTASFLIAERSGTFHGFISGPDAPLQSVTEFKSAWDSLMAGIFSSSLLNKGLFIAFWAILGFIAYSVLYSVRDSVDDSVDFWKELHYVHAQPSDMQRTVLVRFCLLILAIVLWLVYALFFSWTVLPSMLSIIGHTITDARNPAYLLIVFVIFSAIIHLGVILMRFTLLRPRIFTDTSEI